MASGSAFQMKGFGLSALCSRDEAVDGGLEVDDGVEDAVLEPARESLAKKPSTALSQEQEVGVKWKVQRGWRASQARTLGVLCAA